jgi:hypothetical protein
MRDLRFQVSTLGARSRKLGVLVYLTAALTQCTSGTEPGGDPTGLPGVVTYRLFSPNGTEGALLVSGPADEVFGVLPGEGLTEVIAGEIGDVVYVAVVHRFGTQSLTFDADVVDTDAPPEFTLMEVVGPDDVARALAGYALEVVP